MYERPQLVGRQRPVHPPPRFGGACVDVVATEDYLERPAAPDQAGQPHGATASGQDAERHLRLREHRAGVIARGQRSESHVEAECELAAAATDASLDHGDGRLGHRTKRLAHAVVRVHLGWGRRVGGKREDGGHVEVGDEELGIGTAEHDDTHRRVSGQTIRQAGHGEEQLDGEQVDRRTVDGDCRDAVVDLDEQPRQTDVPGPVLRSSELAHTNSRSTARVRADSSGSPAKTPALRSVTPIDRTSSNWSRTSASVPTMARSFGPDTPSMSIIAR